MDSVETRRERDGTFRYQVKVGNQQVVSRQPYQTEAEAEEAGAAAKISMHRWEAPRR
jgi:hypothetical protein